MQLAVFRYILKQKLRGVERYPLVLMLEPLFACNLQCAGCGKIQYPPETLRKRMTPEECWEAAEECGAPIVSVAGGEPLVHPDIARIVEGLMERGRFVILCTNALLLEKELPRFQPSAQLILNVHLDGPEVVHDRVVGRPGTWKTAVAAIRAAKAKGFHVMTNTTLFMGVEPAEFRAFFDEVTALGVDGMNIAPGYAYEKASGQVEFLTREKTQEWFRRALLGWRAKGWVFNHSPFYMDFLEGKRDYDCTPWGNPLRSVLGWQKPCYLLDDAGLAKSYQELLETTDWSRFGPKSGNPKCLHCMTHVGFEPTIVKEVFSSPARFLEMLRGMMGGGS